MAWQITRLRDLGRRERVVVHDQSAEQPRVLIDSERHRDTDPKLCPRPAAIGRFRGVDTARVRVGIHRAVLCQRAVHVGSDLRPVEDVCDTVPVGCSEWSRVTGGGHAKRVARCRPAAVGDVRGKAVVVAHTAVAGLAVARAQIEVHRVLAGVLRRVRRVRRAVSVAPATHERVHTAT